MPRKKDDSANVPILTLLASKNLGIDQHSLREWKIHKQRILRIKKGAKRARGPLLRRELEMKFQLHKEFVQAHKEGIIVFSK